MENLSIGLQLCILNWSKSSSNRKSVKRTWLKEQLKESQKKMYAIIVIVLKVLFQKWFPLEGAKPHEKKKHTK
jgi:hypothetical protein